MCVSPTTMQLQYIRVRCIIASVFPSSGSLYMGVVSNSWSHHHHWSHSFNVVVVVVVVDGSLLSSLGTMETMRLLGVLMCWLPLNHVFCFFVILVKLQNSPQGLCAPGLPYCVNYGTIQYFFRIPQLPYTGALCVWCEGWVGWGCVGGVCVCVTVSSIDYFHYQWLFAPMHTYLGILITN